jgi:hypothetical protein
MTLLAPKEFLTSYPEGGTVVQATVKTQLNTDPGEGKPPQADVSVKESAANTFTSVATFTPANKTLIPIQTPDGSFAASNAFRNELTNNFPLQQGISNSVESAAQEFLGGAGVSQITVDTFLGKSSAAGQNAFPRSAETQSGPNGGASPNAVSLPVQPFNPNNSNDKANGSGLRYPEKAGIDEDSITFEAREYSAQAEDSLGSPQGTCILSIQPSISDSNTVGWGDGRINSIQAALFNAALTGIGKGFPAMGEAVKKASEKIYQDTRGGADFQVYAAAQAAQVNDAFVRQTGKVLNPNLQLLFQGPELRSFNFTFQLSARSQDEADNIRRIIRFFKKNMAPTKSDNDIFLKSPNVFKITYNEKVKKSLNKFKTCALRSFSVDYTPLGTYMTFDDGTMVSYSLTMAFQELFPLYNTSEDYGSETEIGY